MKSNAVLTFLGLISLSSATAFAQGNGNPNLNQGSAPVGLFGHTPEPTTPKPSGPKKPLSAVVATDEKGGGSGSTFGKGQAKLYVLVKDDTGVKGDKIRAAWIADDTGGAFPKGKSLNDFTQTLTGPGQSTSFFAGVSGGFPAGKYHVDLYENSKLVKTLKFSVAK